MDSKVLFSFHMGQAFFDVHLCAVEPFGSELPTWFGMVTYFKDDTHLTAIFQDNVVSRYQNVFVLYFIWTKDDGGGVDILSYHWQL